MEGRHGERIELGLTRFGMCSEAPCEVFEPEPVDVEQRIDEQRDVGTVRSRMQLTQAVERRGEIIVICAENDTKLHAVGITCRACPGAETELFHDLDRVAFVDLEGCSCEVVPIRHAPP